MASGQERGRHQYVFTRDHKRHLSSRPKDSFSQYPWYTEMGLLSHCHSASIPPESEITSSRYWYLHFLGVILVEHRPPFTGMRKKATPSDLLPRRKEGEIKYLVSSSCDSDRRQTSASVGRTGRGVSTEGPFWLPSSKP